jgi:hypothetical protein
VIIIFLVKLCRYIVGYVTSELLDPENSKNIIDFGIKWVERLLNYFQRKMMAISVVHHRHSHFRNFDLKNLNTVSIIMQVETCI